MPSPRNARPQKTRGTAIVLSAGAAKSARGSPHHRTCLLLPPPFRLFLLSPRVRPSSPRHFLGSSAPNTTISLPRDSLEGLVLQDSRMVTLVRVSLACSIDLVSNGMYNKKEKEVKVRVYVTKKRVQRRSRKVI